MEIRYVEAIEDGKIVKVTEEYAKREGLFVLRKEVFEKKEEPKQEFGWRKKKERERAQEEGRFLFDDFRKPLHWRDNQVLSELADNFHWELLKQRKARGLARKQVAQALNVSENDIKLLENGLLPSNDFVLINKIQSYYGVNLRKDKKDFTNEARKMVQTRDIERQREEKRREIAKIRMNERKEERKVEDKKEDKIVEDVDDLVGKDIEIVDE